MFVFFLPCRQSCLFTHRTQLLYKHQQCWRENFRFRIFLNLLIQSFATFSTNFAKHEIKVWPDTRYLAGYQMWVCMGYRISGRISGNCLCLKLAIICFWQNNGTFAFSIQYTDVCELCLPRTIAVYLAFSINRDPE